MRQTVDVGDNELPGLHCFATLPSLRQLKMQCNSLLTAYAPPGAFHCLDTLELAFNSLDARALAQLAALPMVGAYPLLPPAPPHTYSARTTHCAHVPSLQLS